MKTIALVGGGTAGHIWPTIEVGKALKKIDSELKLLYLGVRGGQEEEIAQKQGFKFIPIESAKWDRFFSFKNVLTPYKILKGFFQAKRILRENNVSALFAKGGFVSFPVILAASRLHLPIVSHESDSVMGRTNLWLSRFIKKIAVAFPKSFYPKKIHQKLFYSGIPIRKDFYMVDKNQAKVKLNPDSNLPLLVVTGGSLGALFLNQIIWELLDLLLKHCQIIHLTGEKSISEAEKIREKLNDEQKKRYKIFAFSQRMPEILASADLVVSRAGANTLFELAFLKKPAILVPYPYAAQKHQDKNAEFARSLGGAKVFFQDQFSKKEFIKAILYLLENQDEAKIMGEKLASLYKKNSADLIAGKILKELR